MQPLFWIALALVAYAYAGYPLLLSLLPRLRPRSLAPNTLDTSTLPTVSIVIAARNEEQNLPRKLANLADLTYPAHLLEIVVVSDGSTDRTAAILETHAAAVPMPRLVPVLLPASGGKALALNAAVAHASGDLLVFLDVRQTVDPRAVSALVDNFVDPAVGAVSGELHLHDAEKSGDALGLYWRIETLVRRLESATGSVVGVTGAIYAIRRELFSPLPAGLILDDVLVPMQVARSGHRVLFEPRALASDRIFPERGKEFSRKVRTLTGNYQLLQLAPWLLVPSSVSSKSRSNTGNPLLFRFISHKLLRLAIPALLLVLLLTSAFAGGWFFHTVFALQVVFYLLAAAGSLLPLTKRLKPVGIAHTFVLLNAAAAVALYNFLTGRDHVWT